MSKIKIAWLWIVVGLEVAAIVGLIVWSVAFRQDKPDTQTPNNQGTQQPGLKTPAVALAQVVGGTTKPVAITATPDKSDKRLFVVEQDGTIRTVKADKTIDTTPFLDITGKV